MKPAPKIYAFPRYKTDILRAGPKDFKRHGHEPRPGVGIYLGDDLVQFLTPDRAIKLADQLVDSAERSTRKENPDG